MLADGGVRLDVEWEAPLGGFGWDEFRLQGAQVPTRCLMKQLKVHWQGSK